MYVMSSRFEGFPNTLLEAMAYGLPVVSFDCTTGPAELIEDGVNGYLVPEKEKDKGLADRLETLMNDSDRRVSFGQMAKEVRRLFALECVGAQWDSVLGLGE
jgi:glycosyltransferase involved in cell wall biosynthesis